MTGILIGILQETFMALVGKIAFKAIIERAVTRAVISGLNKLASMTTNTVAKETVEDIVASLQGKSLKVVEELGK